MIRNSSYTYNGYRNEPYILNIKWDDVPDDNGIFPVLELEGKYIICEQFESNILNAPAFRKGFNEWLKSQK